MGKTENVMGTRLEGLEMSTLFMKAIENIANMNQYKFDKSSPFPLPPHNRKGICKVRDGAFDTIHHTELLVELIKEGK